LITVQQLGKTIVKKKIYASLFTGMVLIFAATNGYAKPAKIKSFRGVTHTRIMSHRLQVGETIADVYARVRANDAEYHELVSANTSGTRVATISSRTPLQAVRGNGYQFGHLSYAGRDDVRNLSATGRSRFFLRPPSTTKINTQHFRRYGAKPVTSAQGTIRSTLEAAGRSAGLSSDVMEQLAQIFAWDIDFATDLHSGDRFTVVYERGGFDGSDEIVAAEFTNEGRTHRAVRYIDQQGNTGYYTPEGMSLQKSFLSTPVDYARISSHFDLNRRHPILNRIRAHKGVDYAARTGTPIKATGNGEVTFLGRKGGYGQVVIISHGEHYETLYAHLSDFKNGIQNGSHVRQGEVIGYVGQTGLATGPHLHYEFRVDGEHRNPLTVTAQLSRSLPGNSASMTDFKMQAQRTLAQLNQAKAKTLFARSYSRYN
jgi:murein DD-endopeptidase MepM/ murein hydrolase activator NlpD